ncbi:MAG: hypothetical protein CMF74_02705 [Maricaulis sp.]|jgi:uncharacterized membrane protein|nr:hypothetical protein [Maricaulis sp.]
MQIIHDIWGAMHTAAAFIALATGAMVLLRPKAGRQHKLTGYTYFIAFWVLILAGLPMARDGITAFHWLSLISAGSLIAGLWMILASKRARTAKGRAQLVFGHYKFMAWSYVGLVAAGVSQLATRYAVLTGGMSTFWWAVLLASLAVTGVGAIWIRSSDPGVIARHARALDDSAA